MAKTLSTPDIYGDLGCAPDAEWSERWICFSAREQDEYMASVAWWGPLSLAQMEYLIQGLLPPPKGWLTPPTYLDEFAPLIQRLRQDIQRGAFPKAATADELAGWCDLIGEREFCLALL